MILNLKNFREKVDQNFYLKIASNSVVFWHDKIQNETDSIVENIYAKVIKIEVWKIAFIVVFVVKDSGVIKEKVVTNFYVKGLSVEIPNIVSIVVNFKHQNIDWNVNNWNVLKDKSRLITR